jgi:hypothetical protein
LSSLQVTRTLAKRHCPDFTLSCACAAHPAQPGFLGKALQNFNAAGILLFLRLLWVRTLMPPAAQHAAARPAPRPQLEPVVVLVLPVPLPVIVSASGSIVKAKWIALVVQMCITGCGHEPQPAT